MLGVMLEPSFLLHQGSDGYVRGVRGREKLSFLAEIVMEMFGSISIVRKLVV